jgi:hypothetical protein
MGGYGMMIRQAKLAGAWIAVLAGVGLAGPSRAATILYNDFSDLTGLQLNNSTKTLQSCAASGDGATCTPTTDDMSRKVLRLTTTSAFQSGSAFSTDTVSLASNASFSTAFQFRISAPGGISDSDGTGADGIVFVVQNVSNTSGGSGGGIGYAGLSPSLGIEIDTYNNGAGDSNNGNQIAIELNGSTSSVAHANIAYPPRLNDGDDWWMWVDYDGAAHDLQVRLAMSAARPVAALIDYTVDLATLLGSTDVYAGFTSGTGSAWGNHDIVAWQFNSTFNPIDEIGQVPEPASLALMGFSIFSLGVLRRRVRRG